MTQEITKIVFVDGGIGRTICSVPAIEELAKKNKVIVVAAWPDVFAYNPNIHKIYAINHPYLWDDVVKHGELLTPEPYTDYRYYTQQHHLIESFHHLINGVVVRDSKPNLYLTQDEVNFGFEQIEILRKQFNKKIVVFQPFGATLVMNKNGEQVSYHDDTHRSLRYDDAVRIATELKDECVLLNMSFVNFEGIDNIITPQLNLRQWFSVINACDGVVCIDSVALHVAYALGKKCINILGASYKANIGYNKFTTIQRFGYPKSFRPMRIAGFVDLDQAAMDLPKGMVDRIIENTKLMIAEEKIDEKVEETK